MVVTFYAFLSRHYLLSPLSVPPVISLRHYLHLPLSPVVGSFFYLVVRLRSLLSSLLPSRHCLLFPLYSSPLSPVTTVPVTRLCHFFPVSSLAGSVSVLIILRSLLLPLSPLSIICTRYYLPWALCSIAIISIRHYLLWLEAFIF